MGQQYFFSSQLIVWSTRTPAFTGTAWNEFNSCCREGHYCYAVCMSLCFLLETTVTFDWEDLNSLCAVEKRKVHRAARQMVQQGISCCNDNTHFLKNRYFGVRLLLPSFFLVRFPHFCPPLPPSAPSPLALSLSVSTLKSLAHCAETSGSDVSLLLAPNSRDGAWDDKASFFLFAHFPLYLPAQHSLT